MRYRILMVASALTLFGCLAPVTDANAQGASACGDLSGSEHGLCQAAEALGCSPASTSKACERIAETYVKQTGEAPPWLDPSAYPVLAATPRYYEYLDLETGTTCTDSYLVECDALPTPYDLYFAFHSFMDPPSIPVQEFCSTSRSEIAFLDEVPFSAVTAADIAGATFVTTIVNQSLDSDDTVLIHTCDGNYFKVGAATCRADAYEPEYVYEECTDDTIPDLSVRLRYQRLR